MIKTWTIGALWPRRKSETHGRKQLAGCQDGSTAVEFAFVMPVFLLFLTGIFQFGMVMFVQNNMSHVARDVTRRLAVGELTSTSAVSMAEGSLVNWGIEYTVLVTEPDPSDPTDRDITVSIAAPLEQAAMFDILGILGGTSLATSVTMREEG